MKTSIRQPLAAANLFTEPLTGAADLSEMHRKAFDDLGRKIAESPTVNTPNEGDRILYEVRATIIRGTVDSGEFRDVEKAP